MGAANNGESVDTSICIALKSRTRSSENARALHDASLTPRAFHVIHGHV